MGGGAGRCAERAPPQDSDARQRGMAGNGRRRGQYRRSGVVEGEQDELLQVLPFVFERPHLGSHARSCRRRLGRPQLRTVCVRTGPSALGAWPLTPSRIKSSRPQPYPPPDWGEILARRGQSARPAAQRAACILHPPRASAVLNPGPRHFNALLTLRGSLTRVRRDFPCTVLNTCPAEQGMSERKARKNKVQVDRTCVRKVLFVQGKGSLFCSTFGGKTNIRKQGLIAEVSGAELAWFPHRRHTAPQGRIWLAISVVNINFSLQAMCMDRS